MLAPVRIPGNPPTSRSQFQSLNLTKNNLNASVTNNCCLLLYLTKKPRHTRSFYLYLACPARQVETRADFQLEIIFSTASESIYEGGADLIIADIKKRSSNSQFLHQLTKLERMLHSFGIPSQHLNNEANDAYYSLQVCLAMMVTEESKRYNRGPANGGLL